MTSRAICVAVLTVLPVFGCGTVANLAHTRPEEGGRAPFGGVKRDLAVLHEDGPVDVRARHKSESDYPRQTLAIFCAMDLPFSLIGDVLTWPYTASYSIVNEPVPTPPVVFADSTATLTATSPTPIPTPAKPMPVPAAPVLPQVDRPSTAPPEGLPKLPAPPDTLPKLNKLP